MPDPPSEEVTRLLQAWSGGDQAALERLAPLIYSELERLARRYMAREQEGHTLETGALLNEAFLRLVHWKTAQWQNRSHFYGLAAQIMRRVLVDHARSRSYQKRGGKAHPVSLDEAVVVSPERSSDLVALDEALERLTALDPRKSKVVELRFFGGLSNEETANVLNVSPFTVIRDWNFARAWLNRELAADAGAAPGEPL
ncbi:MAG TPA: sigma-70 family RNA polymerase sigma factor [Terriglobia bacterium]|nr:sigma-70 family RNA polymerase sigma factor [Terriglobia bacterium]